MDPCRAQVTESAGTVDAECEGQQVADSPESLYIGAALQTAPDKVAPSNPITYIATAQTLPPFSIAHGDADCEVPYQQSQILADALRGAGASPELTIIPDAQHDGWQFDTLITPTIAWLQTTLSSGRVRGLMGHESKALGHLTLDENGYVFPHGSRRIPLYPSIRQRCTSFGRNGGLNSASNRALEVIEHARLRRVGVDEC